MNSQEFQKNAYDVGDMLVMISSMGGADSIAFGLTDGKRLIVSARIVDAEPPAEAPKEVPTE